MLSLSKHWGGVFQQPAKRLRSSSPGSRTFARWTWLVRGLVALAILMRLNNGLRFPALNGYDSFGHFTYVWYLLKTGSIPAADQGWSFFHPPLYYALAAALWMPLRGADPKQVLKLISVVFSLVGVASAVFSYQVARKYFDRDRLAHLLAPLYVLFLPVCLYTAPMLGNEGLNAVLCSAALYRLIGTLEEPHPAGTLWLGVLIGLALLTKFTAAAMLGTAILSLLAWTIHTRRWRVGVAHLALLLAATMLLCGWFYARNLARFGNPLAMSRGFFVVEHVENAFPKGARDWPAYISFDPQIFADVTYQEPPLIDSVWSGAFAGTWFEVVGTSVFAKAADNPDVRRAGRLLLALGTVPSLIVLIGIGTALTRLVRYGWSPVIVPVLLLFLLVVAQFVIHTHRVPVFTAVKASYMLPAIVPFSFWFALGIDALRRWRRARNAVLAGCALLLVVIVPVFTYQLVFEAELTAFYFNALGITYDLAGFPKSAQEIFSAVARGYHLSLAHENLAAVAIEEGRLEAAAQELGVAAELAPDQAFGVGEDHVRLGRLNVAEYSSTEAYVYQRMGRTGDAIAAARRALELAPDIPEAHFNLAALLLQSGALDEGWQESQQACALDPDFTEARALLAIADAQRGNCLAAVNGLRSIAALRRPQRAYPWLTGRGDLLDAGLARRKIIPLCADGLNPYAALRACAGTPGATSLVLKWLDAARCP